MILNNVAERARLLVEGAAPFDADRFRRSDLDVIDIVAIPDRLKYPVSETEHEDVLDGFLTQIVIDAEDLILVKHLVDFIVERASGLEIVPKGLLDNGPHKVSVAFRRDVHLMLTEEGDDVRKVLRRNGEIEEAIALGPKLLVHLGETFLQAVVACIIVEVHGEVLHAFHERGELGVVLFNATATHDAFLHVRSESLLKRAASDAEHCKILGQKA